ncbi:hypothetical protein [Pararhizobium haloflavum]|uniref:hypothetical protein n=1 Tax=Pararhizobium haloflavum TaxID=2037914 RepID=UPI000C18FFBA|nr:hypothetical protein [Pararhizobium haloflavum]
MSRFSHTLDSGPVAYCLALALGVASAWLWIGSPAQIVAGHLVIDGDYANAAAAFSVFVRDGWHWPLGANPHFGAVNAFFSDIAPWFALCAKALYSLTGIELTFHWLILINVSLFSAFAYRLMARLCDDRFTRWLGVFLLTFNLIMPVRLIGAQHIALAGYWVVLWAMTAVPIGDDASSRSRRHEFIALVAIATWSHAYLAAMAIAIVLFCLLFKRRWIAASIAIAVPLALLFIIGALGEPHVPTGGAKHFALDLAAYVQSLNWGIAPQPYAVLDIPQRDTIVYLGTGAWLALIVGLAWPACHPGRLIPAQGTGARQRLLILLAAAIALAGFAMAFNLRVAGPVWLELPIPGPLQPLYESFRAVGRFGGVLAYVAIVIAALWLGALARHWRPAVVVGLVAAGLQIGDAYHAGTKSPAPNQRADVASQREALDGLLQSGWTGVVYRDVDMLDLEQQRLIDYLLVDQHGARHFAVAHGARLSHEDVAARSGHEAAQAGDLVIIDASDPLPDCARTAAIKTYVLCLL